MNRNELRNIRAQRDHRYNRAWWCVFCLGCLAAFVSTAATDGFTSTPWVILGGLVGMIAGRRQHARRIAEADALEDEKLAREQAAQAVKAWEAMHAASKRRAPLGQDEEPGPPSDDAR